MHVRGFQPATRSFRYEINERFGAAQRSRSAFRSPFQLAIQVRAALGSDPAREQIRAMTRGPGGQQMNAGELRQRMQRTIPNPFRRTLELNDSLALALTPEQQSALKVKGDSLQMRADAAIAKIAEVLGSVGANPDPQTTMFRMRDNVQAARRMAEQAAKDLGAILTPEQWAKLPANVKNPLMPGRGQPGEGGVRIAASSVKPWRWAECRVPSDPSFKTGGAMNRVTLFGVIATAALTLPAVSLAQARQYPLESTAGLRLHNVTAEPAVLDGKKGLRVTMSEDAMRRVDAMTPEQRARFELLVVIEGLDFANGAIEAEIAGAPAPGAGEGARGFVGIAVRLQNDMQTYDAFYLRPTNGRAEDQERRNHAAQYISHPDWPWFRLRRETPSRYESYVDLVPGVWTRIRIEVRGDRARLYVHGQEQPTLIVNDVKTGASGRGAVALWVGPGTVAHFRNLTVTALSADAPR